VAGSPCFSIALRLRNRLIQIIFFSNPYPGCALGSSFRHLTFSNPVFDPYDLATSALYQVSRFADLPWLFHFTTSLIQGRRSSSPLARNSPGWFTAFWPVPKHRRRRDLLRDRVFMVLLPFKLTSPWVIDVGLNIQDAFFLDRPNPGSQCGPKSAPITVDDRRRTFSLCHPGYPSSGTIRIQKIAPTFPLFQRTYPNWP